MYGINKVQILNILSKKQLLQFDINKIKAEYYTYERILDIVFDSESSPPF